MRVYTKATGLSEIAAKLNALPRAMTKPVVIAALTDAAEPMRAEMARTAPRAPGLPDIADHMVISAARGDNGEPAVAIGPSREFYYGRFLEFGTIKMRARPFVRPAFDALTQTVIGRLAGSFWAAIKKAAGGTSVNTGGGTL